MAGNVGTDALRDHQEVRTANQFKALSGVLLGIGPVGTEHPIPQIAAIGSRIGYCEHNDYNGNRERPERCAARRCCRKPAE